MGLAADWTLAQRVLGEDEPLRLGEGGEEIGGLIIPGGKGKRGEEEGAIHPGLLQVFQLLEQRGEAGMGPQGLPGLLLPQEMPVLARLQEELSVRVPDPG